MISGLELENVRIFEGPGWNFNFEPLTVFCGTNGSGKSTLLKTLLLIRQCLGISENYDTRGGRLQFVGSHVDLGNYYSLVSGNDYNNKISFTVTVKDVLQLEETYFSELLSTFAQNEKQPNLIKDLYEFSLRGKFTFSLDNEMLKKLSTKRAKKSENIYTKEVFLEVAEFDLTLGEKYRLKWTVRRDEKRLGLYHIFIPKDDLPVLGPFKVIKYEETGDGNLRALTRLKGLLPEIVAGRRIDVEDPDNKFFGEPVPILIDVTQGKLVEALQNMDYLGPLRSPAKRYYLSQNLALPQLDLSGEYLPQILHERIDQSKTMINFPLPKETKPEKISLGAALNAWIHYMRTGNLDFSSTEFDLVITKVLVEMMIKGGTGERLYPLADTGFGYSQVLPIIVRGLLLPQKSCLIIEQPELHLNPALQVRLGEFFIAMVLSDKQVLLETHSEHIVNSIRVITAESENDEIAMMSKIYFIDAETGCPNIHELSIQPDGTVPNWPRTFFGEASSLTTRLLKAQKRFAKKI